MSLGGSAAAGTGSAVGEVDAVPPSLRPRWALLRGPVIVTNVWNQTVVRVGFGAGFEVAILGIGRDRLFVRKGMGTGWLSTRDSDFAERCGDVARTVAEGSEALVRQQIASALLDKPGPREPRLHVDRAGQVQLHIAFPRVPRVFGVRDESRNAFDRLTARAMVTAGLLEVAPFQSLDSFHPVVERVAGVGPRHAAVLLEKFDQLPQEDAIGRHLLAWSLALAGDESVAEECARRLPVAPEMSYVLWVRGWQDHARRELIRGIDLDREALPPSWYLAAARLSDAASREELRRRLVDRPNPDLMALIDGDLYDPALSPLFGAAWDSVKATMLEWPDDGADLAASLSPATWPAAEVAARHGHQDALRALVNGARWDIEPGPRLLLAVELCSFRGPASAFPDWFDQWEGKLRWDAARRRYLRGEDGRGWARSP